MGEPNRPPNSLALAILRTLRGWGQKELAAAAGLRPATISDYESGARKPPSLATLHRLAGVMGFEPSMTERVLGLTKPGPAASDRIASGPAVVSGRPLAAGIEAFASAATAEFLRRALGRLTVAQARDEAAALWRRLAPYTPAQREAVVREIEEFRGAALAERLCAESRRAAADSATAARELAELAVLVAELSAGEPAACSRLEGFCRVHLGNALRAGGTLPAADEAFTRALALWRAGAGGDPLGLLDEAQVLSLEASLRRAQRRLPEALALLDRALAMERGEKRPHLLLKRAKTLEETGDFEGAVVNLGEALALLADEHEPRLLWAARFNLVEVLVRAGRHAEAEPLLAEVGELAGRHASRLDRLRLRWLAGRIAAGRGRAEEAITLLRQVRADFAAAGIAYDTALVTLELAALLAERGATAEVKALARHLVPLFRAQGVGREALASLALFRRAAEQEAVTAELARGLAERLQRDREPQVAPAPERLPLTHREHGRRRD
jgi:transcriptional regulator with XRE-family HTH domain